MQRQRRIGGDDIEHAVGAGFTQPLRHGGNFRAEGGVDAITEFDDQRLIAHRKKAWSRQHGGNTQTRGKSALENACQMNAARRFDARNDGAPEQFLVHG